MTIRERRMTNTNESYWKVKNLESENSELRHKLAYANAMKDTIKFLKETIEERDSRWEKLKAVIFDKEEAYDIGDIVKYLLSLEKEPHPSPIRRRKT